MARCTVRGLATDRVGIPRDVLDPGDPYGIHPKNATGTVAHLVPVGGGVERTTEPDQVVREQQD